MDERDKIKGQNELQEMVLNTGLCTGCGACIDLCPYLRSYRGKTAILFPCTLTQGKCFAFCPKVEVDLDKLSQGIPHLDPTKQS
jgi:coenzyme F420 hydrogenase subunit beta